MEATKERRLAQRTRKASGSRRTLIVGLGATGLAAARYLTALGERVLVIDSRPNPPCLDALRGECPDVPVELETLDAKWLEGASQIVVSPGLGVEIPIVVAARRAGIDVLSDVELFARAADAPVLAVTGSNGKSTATTLTARLLEAAGARARAGGNLGPPALDLLESSPPDAYVLEISSFQMETTESLRPVAAAVLNLSADHLDRHGDIEHYGELKAKLLRAADYAVFNFDDPFVRRMGESCMRPIPFSIETALASGWSVVESGGERHLARDGRPLLPARELALRGRHNEANALAAMALTAVFLEISGRASDDATAAVLAELKRFAGLPHRCRPVGERRGVQYVDDSKGTNVGAAVAALSGLDGPIVLIAGGVGKGADFAPLAAAARGKVKAAVLIGRAADDLEAAFAGVCPTSRAGDMPSAVRAAADLAAPGDTVLLSPACASLDMFRDYRHRGEAFAAAVEELPA
ncbi:MAG: UDP-N-acetylmuramoyl-L-alanine--D-glutamate ligase [Gammaproteobacteria bacterium]|nr:UDP-N-acetylmuramoyl-L-alanine--D-glutamate ligase [Gammaproteobacteria bacterium]